MTQQARFGAGTLTVSRDWNCRVWMGGGWSAAGIETAPANGRVEVNGGSWTYVPNPGFTGSDRFALNYNLAGTRIVNSVDVTIVP